jgi:hypothetical protein
MTEEELAVKVNAQGYGEALMYSETGQLGLDPVTVARLAKENPATIIALIGALS